MRKLTFIAALVGVFSAAAGAKETPVESRIVSLGLFKNGLAVAKRAVTVPRPGTYRPIQAVKVLLLGPGPTV